MQGTHTVPRVPRAVPPPPLLLCALRRNFALPKQVKLVTYVIVTTKVTYKVSLPSDVQVCSQIPAMGKASRKRRQGAQTKLRVVKYPPIKVQSHIGETANVPGVFWHTKGSCQADAEVEYSCTITAYDPLHKRPHGVQPGVRRRCRPGMRRRRQPGIGVPSQCIQSQLP